MTSAGLPIMPARPPARPAARMVVVVDRGWEELPRRRWVRMV